MKWTTETDHLLCRVVSKDLRLRQKLGPLQCPEPERQPAHCTLLPTAGKHHGADKAEELNSPACLRAVIQQECLPECSQARLQQGWAGGQLQLLATARVAAAPVRQLLLGRAGRGGGPGPDRGEEGAGAAAGAAGGSRNWQAAQDRDTGPGCGSGEAGAAAGTRRCGAGLQRGPELFVFRWEQLGTVHPRSGSALPPLVHRRSATARRHRRGAGRRAGPLGGTRSRSTE